jgi:hypothetical protein
MNVTEFHPDDARMKLGAMIGDPVKLSGDDVISTNMDGG